MADLIYDSAYIYLEDEDYYKEPKEIFKFVKKYIDIYSPKDSDISLLDVGCAKGEFLYYMKNNASNIQFMDGVDLLPEMIDAAKDFEGLRGVDFSCGSADNYKLGKKYNVITMLGLLSAMTNIEDVFSTASNHQNSGDLLFVLSRFNNHNVDVYHKFSNTYKGKDFKITVSYSKETVIRLLNKYGYNLVEDVRFNLPFDIQENTNDPIRSWTVNTDTGRRFKNGLGLIFDLDMFICQKK
jgi:2-polyprenyl-3-methyl-5-hydroxy-6-metoxy-1,4-benzoquinol methylase